MKKIEIELKGETVLLDAEGLSEMELLNLIVNGAHLAIKNAVEDPAKRAALATLIGEQLAAEFTKEEKINDQS